jgi:hypothetical protein
MATGANVFHPWQRVNGVPRRSESSYEFFVAELFDWFRVFDLQFFAPNCKVVPITQTWFVCE